MNDAMNHIQARIDAGENITLDAGTGTELQAKGVPMHPKVWCGVAHMSHPDETIAVHSEYILAGADIITANTYSTNRNMMGPAGLGDEAMPSTRRAVELALQARERTQVDRPVAVAGSMSHQIPVAAGTAGRLPEMVPDDQTARANFEEMAQTLAESGVDLILMEMMYDPDLSTMAIEAARATGLPVWVGTSARPGKDDEIMSFLRERDVPFEDLVKTLVAAGGDVMGVMHTNIPLISPAIGVIRKHFDGPVSAYPDGGVFIMPEWQFDHTIEPAEFAVQTKAWYEEGIQIVGGCCGLGIKHIAAMHH